MTTEIPQERLGFGVTEVVVTQSWGAQVRQKPSGSGKSCEPPNASAGAGSSKVDEAEEVVEAWPQQQSHHADSAEGADLSG